MLLFIQGAEPVPLTSLGAGGLGRIGEQRGVWRYPLADGLGSVRQWTDAQGRVTCAADYAPYGEQRGQQGGTASRWGYTGEWQDAGVGLLYLRARWLDVATGRFTQVDQWPGDIRQPQTQNGWSYADGNPINFTDHTGRWREPAQYEIDSIDLNRVWKKEMKPPCCREIFNSCWVNRDPPPSEPEPASGPFPPPLVTCPGSVFPRTGVVIAPDRRTFTSADDYMRYWLAWEYKANPCYYRQEANCAGTALRTSSMIKVWAPIAEDVLGNPSYYEGDKERGNVSNWDEMVKEGQFQRLEQEEPVMAADLIVFAYGPIERELAWMAGLPNPRVWHVAVATNYSTSSGKLCFEKEGSGEGYYQLRPCAEMGYQEVYRPPEAP